MVLLQAQQNLTILTRVTLLDFSMFFLHFFTGVFLRGSASRKPSPPQPSSLGVVIL